MKFVPLSSPSSTLDLKNLATNLSLIKDFVTIIFTVTATIIAVLTYRRAIATVLQPKRTELIKKQTELFSNFLTFINDNQNSIDDGFDYSTILRYNIYLTLRDYGLIEPDIPSDLLAEYNAKIAGWIQFLENDIHQFVYIKGDIDEYNASWFNAGNRARPTFYNSVLGTEKVAVHRIFYTHKHRLCFETLRMFSLNPFLPEVIQKAAEQIGRSMHENIHIVLKLILEKLLDEYHRAQNNEPGSHKHAMSEEHLEPMLYRLYEEERINHEEEFRQLKQLIRDHLNIDEKW